MKLKKLLTTTLATTVILTNTLPVFAGSIPKINVNDSKILIKNSPFSENGRMYIPLRNVSENLGANVAWDAKTQTATITQGYTTIVQRIGSKTARVNNKIVELDAAAKIKDGATYVPVRFIAETLGAEIKFDQVNNTVNISYDFPKDGGQKYDFLGRSIRTTNLPKNAKDFSYILQGVPNEMYELRQRYMLNPKAVEGKDFTRPVNMAEKENRYYREETVQMWKKIIEKNVDLKLNVNYKTVNDTWAKSMAQTYMDSKEGEDGYYDRNFKDTRNYAKYIKDNKITIEGDYYVEPSICYTSSSSFYLRCWVKFKVESTKLKEVELYEKNPQKIKTNTWYEGYIDVGVGTNNGNSIGTDLGIVQDHITLTEGIKEVK